MSETMLRARLATYARLWALVILARVARGIERVDPQRALPLVRAMERIASGFVRAGARSGTA